MLSCFSDPFLKTRLFLSDTAPPSISILRGRRRRLTQCLPVQDGQISMIELLLQAGAAIGAEDMYRRGPLHYCMLFQTTSTAKLLLRKGAKANSTVRPTQLNLGKLLVAEGRAGAEGVSDAAGPEQLHPPGDGDEARQGDRRGALCDAVRCCRQGQRASPAPVRRSGGCVDTSGRNRSKRETGVAGSRSPVILRGTRSRTNSATPA